MKRHKLYVLAKTSKSGVVHYISEFSVQNNDPVFVLVKKTTKDLEKGLIRRGWEWLQSLRYNDTQILSLKGWKLYPIGLVVDLNEEYVTLEAADWKKVKEHEFNTK